MTWLLLSEATVLIDHDVQKARERLAQAIKKAWLVRSPGLPQPTVDPNVPLRIQVTLLPGLKLEGRAWLDDPVLHWEASEIECLCKPWTPSSKALASVVATQAQTAITIWDEDLVRLCGSDNLASRAFTKSGGLIAAVPADTSEVDGGSATRNTNHSALCAHANSPFAEASPHVLGCRANSRRGPPSSGAERDHAEGKLSNKAQRLRRIAKK